MSIITWLHLSDWHQGQPDEHDRNMVLKALLKDIENRHTINQRLKKIDFVVFSGDLAFSGKAEEYATAEKEFLKPVSDAVGVPPERWFLVPGNHDVDQAKLLLLPAAASNIASDEELNKYLSDPDFVDVLVKPTRAYASFCERFIGAGRGNSYTYAHTLSLSVNGNSVGLVGLNSAMLCGLHKIKVGGVEKVKDYGELVLGERQIEKGLSAIQHDTLRIAVVHHPFGWLSLIEGRTRTERRLIRDCHFILRGHEHESQVEVPSGTAGNCAIVSAGATYGGRKYPIGYNFVDIDYEQQQATVYLRRYVDAGGRFDPDTDVTGFETPGYSSFVLPKISGKLPGERGIRSGESAEQQVASASKPADAGAQPRVSTASVAGDPWSAQNPALLKTLGDVYKAQHASVLFEYVYSSFRVQANCLLGPGETGYGEPDLVETTKVFKPADVPLHCLKVNVVVLVKEDGAVDENAEDLRQFLGQIDLEFEDQGEGKAGYIVVPARTIDLAGYRELLLFFDPVLQPGTGPYRLKVEWRVKNSLEPLMRSGRDELYLNPTRAAGTVGRIDLVAHIPESFGPVVMKESRRAEAAAGGAIMKEEDLAAFQAPPGFRQLGWTGRNLKSAAPFAVDLVKF